MGGIVQRNGRIQPHRVHLRVQIRLKMIFETGLIHALTALLGPSADLRFSIGGFGTGDAGIVIGMGRSENMHDGNLGPFPTTPFAVIGCLFVGFPGAHAQCLKSNGDLLDNKIQMPGRKTGAR
jgi:hypothetical protein